MPFRAVSLDGLRHLKYVANVGLLHNPTCRALPERQALVNRCFAGGPEMADSNKPRSQLLQEIAELFAQQSEALDNVTFVGWTRKEDAAYKIRSERLTLLFQRLSDLGPT